MEKVLIVYWSGTGNTEIMAEKIKEGIELEGAEVTLKRVDEADAEMIDEFDAIALGCPSMGNESLEEDEFEPFFEDVSPKLEGKKVALFGSYGWGSGEWMDNWVSRVQDLGAELFEDKGLIINETPDSDGEETCIEFGKGFAKF